MLPQLPKDTTVIPENVLIKMSLATDLIADTKHTSIEVDTILNVREAILSNKTDIIPTQLPDKKVAVNSINIEQYNYLILDTLVHLYNDIWLTRNESSLTLPLEMHIEHPINFGSIVFTYLMDTNIELKYKLDE